MGLSDIFLTPLSGVNADKLIYVPDTQSTNPCLRLLAYGGLEISARERIMIKKLDSFCVIFTFSGSGRVTFGDSEYLLPDTSFALIDCSSTHTLCANENTWELIAVYFQGAAARYFFESLGNGSTDPVVLAEHTRTGFSSHFVDIFENAEAYTGDSLLQLGFLTNLLIDAINEKNSIEPEKITPPDYLRYVKRLFDEEYTRSYTLDMLEQRFHINKYKIAKDFTKYYGMPPIHYLNRQRIEAAKNMLIRTNNRINEISYSVGFETTNHFINLFKKYTSMTPAVYRKLQKGR